jgi:hypothetical protein
VCGVLGGQVQDGAQQHLTGDQGCVPVAGHERDRRGQVAARAVAHHGEVASVGAEVGGAVGRPPGGGVAILDRHRIAVFGRESVLDRRDHHLGLGGQRGAPPFGAVGLAGAEPAAVEVHHQGQHVDRPSRRSVHPHRQSAAVGQYGRLDADEDAGVRLADDHCRAGQAQGAVAPIAGRAQLVVG